MRKLRRFRDFAGFTQQGLADEVDISLSTYSTYESEDVNPKVDIALAIVSVINKNLPEGYSVTLEDLFSDEEANEGATNDTLPDEQDDNR